MKPKTLTPIALIIGSGIAILLNIPQAQNFTPAPANICEVKRVIDGDTIACTNELRVRLCGIDAPESNQPLGIEAKQALINLVAGQKVTMVVVDIDKYGRAIAEITTDKNISVELVRSGMAHHYPQYSGICPSKDKIIMAEGEARGNKLGVWADERSIKPWEWRKNK